MSKNLIDIEMPDGTIISDVPEGITKAEVTRRYGLSQHPSHGASGGWDAPTVGSVAKSAASAAWESLKGIVTAPMNTPDEPIGSGTPSHLWEIAKQLGHGVVDPPINAIQHGMAGNYNAMGADLGQTLVQTVPALYGAYEMGKPAIASGLRAVETGLNKSSIKSEIKALKPTTPEMMAQAQKVAPILATRGDWATTGRRVDALHLNKLDQARAEWKASAESVPKTAETNTSDLLQQLEAKVNERQLHSPEGEPLLGGNSPSADAFNIVKGMASADRPTMVKFAQLRKYQAILDDQVESMGGFKATGSDGMRVRQLREVSNIIRDTLAKYDTPLAKANAELTGRLRTAEIIETRNKAGVLNDVRNPRTFPGIGNPYDDFAASAIGGTIGTGIGYMLGDPTTGAMVGAGGAEALNLARQARGLSSARAVLTGKMARGAGAMADSLQPRYKGLLGEGLPLPNGGQEMGEPINVTNGRPYETPGTIYPSGNKPAPNLGQSNAGDVVSPQPQYENVLERAKTARKKK